MQEIWKDVEEYPDIYEVSTLGNVRNKITGRMQGKHDNGHGYQNVSLSRDGKYKMRYVHRLVAIAFIDNPDNKPEVHHIDSDRSNNKLDNLQWVTTKENNNFPDKIAHMKSNDVWRAKASESMAKARDKAIVINSYHTLFTKDGVTLEFNSLADGARELGLDKGNATRVANGKQAHTHGYVIEYVGKERVDAKSEQSSMIKSGEMTVEYYYETKNAKKAKFTKDGVSQVFKSLTDGAKILGLDKSSASRVAKGKQAHTHGYTIEYI